MSHEYWLIMQNLVSWVTWQPGFCILTATHDLINHTATDTVGSVMPVGNFASFINEKTEKRVLIYFAEDNSCGIYHKPSLVCLHAG
jgi:hypothetical protein